MATGDRRDRPGLRGGTAMEAADGIEKGQVRRFLEPLEFVAWSAEDE